MSWFLDTVEDIGRGIESWVQGAEPEDPSVQEESAQDRLLGRSQRAFGYGAGFGTSAQQLYDQMSQQAEGSLAQAGQRLNQAPTSRDYSLGDTSRRQANNNLQNFVRNQSDLVNQNTNYNAQIQNLREAAQNPYANTNVDDLIRNTAINQNYLSNGVNQRAQDVGNITSQSQFDNINSLNAADRQAFNMQNQLSQNLLDYSNMNLGIDEDLYQREMQDADYLWGRQQAATEDYFNTLQNYAGWQELAFHPLQTELQGMDSLNNAILTTAVGDRAERFEQEQQAINTRNAVIGSGANIVGEYVSSYMNEDD